MIFKWTDNCFSNYNYNNMNGRSTFYWFCLLEVSKTAIEIRKPSDLKLLFVIVEVHLKMALLSKELEKEPLADETRIINSSDYQRRTTKGWHDP